MTDFCIYKLSVVYIITLRLIKFAHAKIKVCVEVITASKQIDRLAWETSQVYQDAHINQEQEPNCKNVI